METSSPAQTQSIPASVPNYLPQNPQELQLLEEQENLKWLKELLVESWMPNHLTG